MQSTDNTPLAGVTVTAFRLDYYGEQRRYTAVESARTASDGTYSLRGLDRGKYYVVASAAERQDPSSRALQSTFYPSGSSVDGAVPVGVEPGFETAAIQIGMSDVAGYSVCGDVEWMPDLRPRPLSLTLVPWAADMPLLNAKTASVIPKPGSPSHFCFASVPTGDYLVELRGNVGVTGRISVTVPAHNLSAVRVVAMSAVRIEGFVHAEQILNRQGVYQSMAAPVAILAGTDVPVFVANPNAELLPKQFTDPPRDRAAMVPVPGIEGDVEIRIRLEPVEEFQDGSTAAKAEVRNGGAFTLAGLALGRYRVIVENAPLGFFVKKIRYGGKDLAAGELELLSGAVGPLDILLSGDAVFIRGMVTDGNGYGVEGASVSLLAEPGSAAAQTIYSGQGGQFAFWNLAPGPYAVWAWQDLDPPGLATRPSFLRSFSARGMRVEAINPADPSYILTIATVPREDVTRGGW